MADITAAMVRELREKSGAAMMDCKKALTATGGDIEAAFDELRKRGLKTAAKKEGRATAQGRVAAHVADDGRSGAFVALACETDFVANTDDFQAFLSDLAAHVFEHRSASVEEALAQPWKGEGTLQDALTGLIGKLGENMLVAGVAYHSNPGGLVASYVHHDNMQGAMVSVTTNASKADGEATLRDLCMHIVVFKPAALSREDVSAERIEREKSIIKEGLAGKPEDIQEKIASGKLEKFFAESTLVGQPWIKDDKTSVEKALESALGEGTRVVAFTHFALGS